MSHLNIFCQVAIGWDRHKNSIGVNKEAGRQERYFYLMLKILEVGKHKTDVTNRYTNCQQLSQVSNRFVSFFTYCILNFTLFYFDLLFFSQITHQLDAEIT